MLACSAFICFCMSCIFSANLFLIAGVIQGTEETERLVFDGICLSAKS